MERKKLTKEYKIDILKIIQDKELENSDVFKKAAEQGILYSENSED
jgi:hypothetical protein